MAKKGKKKEHKKLPVIELLVGHRLVSYTALSGVDVEFVTRFRKATEEPETYTVSVASVVPSGGDAVVTGAVEMYTIRER